MRSGSSLFRGEPIQKRPICIGVLDWKLTDKQWKRLDDVSTIDLGLPHGNRYIYGATYNKIDNHRI